MSLRYVVAYTGRDGARDAFPRPSWPLALGSARALRQAFPDVIVLLAEAGKPLRKVWPR